MAAYLAVANFDETEKYDFTLSTNKVRFIAGSLSDTTSELGEPVELRFQTITKGTTAQIRTALTEVEAIIGRTAEFFLNLTSQNSIWIYTNSDGERVRRALVLTWQRVDTVQGHSDPLLDISKTVISDWIIQRKGFWEATLSHIYDPALTWWSAFRSGGCQGGSYTGTGHGTEESGMINKGTALGRIRQWTFSWPTVYTTKYFNKMWLGMKTTTALDGGGNLFKPFANFDNVWGIPDTYISYITLNYTSGISGIALNNNCVDIQFDSPADPTWQNRISVPVPYHNTTPRNQAGTYQILFRMRASGASGVFRVAMFQAWDKIDQRYSAAETYQDVFVESDEFHLYEMGVIQVPPENFRSARRTTQEDFYQLNIGLTAERISASGNGTLQIDYLIWIPQEHSIALTNIRAKAPGAGVDLITDEEDIVFGQTTVWTPTWEKFIHEVSENNWRWPSDPDRDLIAVMAADIPIGDGHHPMFEAITVYDFEVIPRYHSYNKDAY